MLSRILSSEIIGLIFSSLENRRTIYKSCLKNSLFEEIQLAKDVFVFQILRTMFYSKWTVLFQIFRRMSYLARTILFFLITYSKKCLCSIRYLITYCNHCVNRVASHCLKWPHQSRLADTGALVWSTDGPSSWGAPQQPSQALFTTANGRARLSGRAHGQPITARARLPRAFVYMAVVLQQRNVELPSIIVSMGWGEGRRTRFVKSAPYDWFSGHVCTLLAKFLFCSMGVSIVCIKTVAACIVEKNWINLKRFVFWTVALILVPKRGFPLYMFLSVWF